MTRMLLLVFNALEAVHYAVAQWLERTPRVRADGPRHLGIIGDDYRVCNHKEKKNQRRVYVPHPSLMFLTPEVM